MAKKPPAHGLGTGLANFFAQRLNDRANKIDEAVNPPKPKKSKKKGVVRPK